MAKSNLEMFTKKMIKFMSLKKLQKKLMFLMKPKNFVSHSSGGEIPLTTTPPGLK